MSWTVEPLRNWERSKEYDKDKNDGQADVDFHAFFLLMFNDQMMVLLFFKLLSSSSTYIKREEIVATQYLSRIKNSRHIIT